jgi:predicted TIM-barrel fold metal-dependent hydrolase
MVVDGVDRVMSADSHILEPHDLWQARIERRYRDRAPRLVREETTDRLACDDVQLQLVGFLVGAGRKGEQSRPEGRWEEVLPAGYDPEARVGAAELDGVDAEILFPTTAMLLYPIRDLDFQWALFRTYNTWLAEEFCASHPERYKGIALLNHETVPEAVAELKRAKDLGLVGVMVPLYPGEDNNYHDPRFDELWATAIEYEMPVNLHSATARDTTKAYQKWTAVDGILDTYEIQRILLNLIFSGLFDRFPGLKIVSAENDVGWAGSMLERADNWWLRNRTLMASAAVDVRCERLPSEYFHDNVSLTFMEDRTGMLAREIIGTQTLMWGSDFPHHNSTWPESQRVLADQFAGVSNDDRRLVVWDNVRRLYQL